MKKSQSCKLDAICPKFDMGCRTRSYDRIHYPDRASALDFKETTAPRFSQSDVFFLSIFSNEQQQVPPVNHKQKCLIKRICGTFDMKSNYYGPVIPKI